MAGLMNHRAGEIHVITEVGDGMHIPTSGNPGRWPLEELWERMDLAIVKENMDFYNAEIAAATPQELEIGTATSGIYFTPEQRSLLAKYGDVSVDFPNAT